MTFNIIFGFIFLEIIIYFTIRYLKKDFQWLITSSEENIYFAKDQIIKFAKNSYDKVLGWDRRPGTSKKEEIKGVGEIKKNIFTSEYHMNDYNSRLNINHEHLSKKIITFGDSYTFCRHVNDNQTWQWHLSKFTNTNVVNHGVGNYGVDQSLKKMHKEINKYKDKAEIIILSSVPETIVRIVNMWKHYVEYGNIFGFKGRFINKRGKLCWIDNAIDDLRKLENLELHNEKILQHDACYTERFKKDIIKFPFTLSLLKSYKRNIPLIYFLILRKFYLIFNINNETIINKAYNYVMEGNHKHSISLYKNKDYTDLLKKIIIQFKNDVESMNMQPIYLFIPYLHDLIYFKKNKIYYNDLMHNLNHYITVVDMTEDFIQYDKIEDLYVSNNYGAHLSNVGNRVTAECISRKINEVRA